MLSPIGPLCMGWVKGKKKTTSRKTNEMDKVNIDPLIFTSEIGYVNTPNRSTLKLIQKYHL